MLVELKIKDYLLIESLELRLESGLNVLTGETGAGKSILLGSVLFLLGDRANGSILRKGADRCQVSGCFELEPKSRAHALLEELSLIDPNEKTLIIRRELETNGRSRAYINDQMVNLSTLASVGDLLVDVHGQHDHQLLLKCSEQRDLLDGFAGHEDLLAKVKSEYLEWREILKQCEATQISEQEKEQKIDLYRFQVQEIDSAKIVPGEEEEIERVLPKLKNGEKIRNTAQELYSHLYESEGSILERLGKAGKLIDSLQSFGVKTEDEKLKVEQALSHIKQILESVENLRENPDVDPGKLDELYSRLDQISKLKKKYGATVEEILRYKDKVDSQLESLENYGSSQAQLKESLDKTYGRLMKECKKLSFSREKAGSLLSGMVRKELKDLGFNKCGFQVTFEKEKDNMDKEVLTVWGLEQCEFLFSANSGEPLKPFRAIASGGELSRVMLALKKVLAKVDPVSTLIFDEIDSGVGGSIAYSVGEKLKELSRSSQVLMITHLPQIAVFAQNHISVNKRVIADRTEVTVEILEDKRRVKEVARMLGGVHKEMEEPTPLSIKHATELLVNSSVGVN